MDEINKSFAPELAPGESRRWVGRLVIAVVLGAAIWNFLVAFTEGLVLPLLARVMEADSQSPLYLGNGKIAAPVLLTAVLELGLAGIVAAILYSRLQRPVRMVRVVRRVAAPSPVSMASASPAPARPMPAPAQAAAPKPQVSTTEPETVRPAIGQAAADSAVPSGTPPPPPPKLAQPETKAKAAKAVYYNLVGEPIDSDE
ncbi:MAG TPA: hypothetical protein VMH85_22205 [Terriglobales bacterium]|nr:hypothetical protein [Terriglobales bacterium]